MEEQQEKLVYILLEVLNNKQECENVFASFFQSLCNPLTKQLFKEFPRFGLLFNIKLTQEYEKQDSLYIRKC